MFIRNEINLEIFFCHNGIPLSSEMLSHSFKYGNVNYHANILQKYESYLLAYYDVQTHMFNRFVHVLVIQYYLLNQKQYLIHLYMAS